MDWEDEEETGIGLYKKISTLGSGTYGTVFSAIHIHNKQTVAIKKNYNQNNAAQREKMALKRVQGVENTIELLEVIEGQENDFFVFDLMKTDLDSLLQAQIRQEIPRFTLSEVKCILLMLLRGVEGCQKAGVLHRDLKPNNLLFSSTGELKIADFGMATFYKRMNDDTTTPRKPMTNQVITREYRPPELFFGETNYCFEVDIWSVGCVFAEMLLLKPLFDGCSDIDQLSKIFSVLGTPNETTWKDAKKLPYYMEFSFMSPANLVEIFPSLDKSGTDLLSKILTLDPQQRISVHDALQHPFFTQTPFPVDCSELCLTIPPPENENELSSGSTAESRNPGIMFLTGRNIFED